MRIVSLLPATTEIVHHLGLGGQLVGVSHACRAGDGGLRVPALTRSRVPVDLDAATTDARVRELLASGEALFELDEETLTELRPDVVLAQSLCNVCAIDGSRLRRTVARLGRATRLVEWSPTTLTDVVAGVEQIGEVVGAASAGAAAAQRMRQALFAVCQSAAMRPARPRVAFLEWLDPLFCAGHWIPELVELAGGVDVMGKPGGRSTEVAPDDLLSADPDVIIACCCGWPAARTAEVLAGVADRPWWRRLRAVRERRVYVVDAESAFTTPGPGVVESCRLLAGILSAEANSPAA